MPKRKAKKKVVKSKPRPILILGAPLKAEKPKKEKADVRDLKQSIHGAIAEFLKKPNKSLITVITEWMEKYCDETT